MPELPDITIYLEALQRRVLGRVLARARILSPFLLRTAAPPIASLHGKKVVDLRRLGKRVALGFENGSWLVLHLMIAGRLHWIPLVVPPNGPAKAVRSKGRNAKMPGAQALFEFDTGVLVLTEAGTKRRASLHVLPDEAALQALNPGGLEIMGSALDQFAQVLTSQNHTLKRALTDPRLLSGIGNAYSDEILHRARLSPVALTQKLSPGQIERLHQATKQILTEWTVRLRSETGDGFPENITAFRHEMAVHGKFGQPCPVCGAKVQRIRYASNETNYCPGCQTGGKLLADRSLSLLLKRDWPRTPEQLEEMRAASRAIDAS